MYKKIPRRLRYVQKDSEKITVFIIIRNEVPMTTTTTTTSSRDGNVHLPHDTDVHLSVRSSCLLMTTFICRCVHPISWWRRSSVGAFIYLSHHDDVPSHWTSFVTRLMKFPIGDRHVERVVPINGYIWTEALNRKPFFLFVVVVDAVLLLVRFACGGFVSC